MAAPPRALGEIAFAHEPPAGLGPAPVRAIVNLSTHATRDVAWFQLETPPLFDHADDAWVTAFDAPSKGSRRQAILAVGDRPFERIAAGDELRTAGLACSGSTCAVLTTRVSDVTAPGATLFVGTAVSAPPGWKRTDIESVDHDELPLGILALDSSSSTARVALASPSSVRFLTAGDSRSQTDASLPSHHGIVAIDWANGSYALATHGSPVDERGCAPAGASLVFQRAGGDPHTTPLSAPPYKATLLDLAGTRVIIWLASVNCLVRDRLVVYAQLLDDDVAPIDSAIPIADARDFAARAAGDTLELFLVRDDGVFSVSARCAPPKQ